MKKAILITGGPSSGKTTKAKEIASEFQPDEVVYINYQGISSLKDSFLFSGCTPKTKLIIFDELRRLNDVEYFFHMVSNPIFVNKKMKPQFAIHPQLILICQSSIKPEELNKWGASFSFRFDVITCKCFKIDKKND